MRNVTLLALFLVFIFGACKQKTTAHLPPEQMVPILADLFIADAYSATLQDSLHKNELKNYDSLAKWTEHILARHQLTMTSFNQSMDWYRDRPNELDSLFARMIPFLDSMKSK
ncbi:MAG: DUF4296 domain-containing protein [Bacteroidetes bacterium]|nr:DUF4296 domain-containing protein [Bacteroidota bacterium]